MQKKTKIQPVFYSPEMDQLFVACMDSLERVFMFQDRKIIKFIGQKSLKSQNFWDFRSEYELVGTIDWEEND